MAVVDAFSLLIGGKAGDGIDKAGSLISRIFSRLGLRLYIYRDYPSIIRGGHTFSIIRASGERIASHANQVDFILALNQDTLDLHKPRLKDNTVIIYNADLVKPEAVAGSKQALGLPLETIIKEENAAPVMRNSCIIGAFSKAAGISWQVLEEVFRKNINKDLEQNLKISRRGYEAVTQVSKIEPLSCAPLPVVTGNEAVGLGLIKAGLNTYIAYPMTPSSPLLHFLADAAKDFSLEVFHPESEIGVILMALGFAYAGKKVAVGTSGGGFCLMTEGLSLSGMAELPIVIMVGQRPGPSTGLPTYTAQTELNFVLNAGQGEFLRFLVAPGDAEEAYSWSTIAMNIAWKYQIPAIILSDKNLGESGFNFDIDSLEEIGEQGPVLWDRNSPYKRYADSQTGISALAFAPAAEAVIKVNSYEHDEYGITTEDAAKTKFIQDKRLRKARYLAEEIAGYDAVKVYGNRKSKVALLCWGSNKGVCLESAQRLGLKVIQPVVLWPFPLEQFKEATQGLKKIIAVENNATGQLVKLVNSYGFSIDEKILRYDGRPFSLDELEARLKKIL